MAHLACLCVLVGELVFGLALVVVPGRAAEAVAVATIAGLGLACLALREAAIRGEG